MRSSEIHPLADADLEQQFLHLQKNFCSAATLNKFLDAVEKAKRKIQDHPDTWSFVKGSRTIRKVQIKIFAWSFSITCRQTAVH